MKLYLLRLKLLACLVALSLFIPVANAQTYCTPTYVDGCSYGNEVYNFTLNGELCTSFNDLAISCPGTIGTGYDDRTSETPVILFIGNTYTIDMSEDVMAPFSIIVGNCNVQVWIDFNNDGVFQSSETITGGAINNTIAPYTTIAIPTPVTVPGTYRMRIAVIPVSTGTYPNINPCGGTSTTAVTPYGETVDYLVTIENPTTVSACTTPTLTLGATACSSQIINWAAVSGSSGYEYVVNTTSGAPTTGPYTATTSTTFTATGLSPSTLYYAYVRDSCGACSSSSWTSITFTTGAGPASITGTTLVCPGGTTHLSDMTASGTWSSSAASVATISGSGVVTGVSGGTTDISYTVGGCGSGVVVTVTPMPGITGATTVCPGATTQLSDATSGGTWSSSNMSVATISGTGLVYGVAAGTTTIAYAAGGCSTDIAVTVGLPAITGATTVCPGATTQLSDATSGGTWSSSSMSVATISGTGLVYGVAAGTTTISYASGGCLATVVVTVGSLPAITGTTSVCPGSTTQLSDVTGGGVWSSGTLSVATISTTGVVYGAGTGTTVITYAIGACTATTNVTVATLPPITGGSTVCSGSTLDLSDATPGGVWTSGSATIATVSATGVVTGATAGGTTITYTEGGCMATLAITVGNSIGAISGTTSFCVTSTTTLSDATTGGVWSSGNTSVATISGTTVHGVTGGTATISYTEGGCSVTTAVSVVPNNGGTITGADTVCIGTPDTLSDAQAGGTWSISSTAHATVNASTGVVTGTGTTTGVFNITYTVTNTCGTYTVTRSNMHVLTEAECVAGIAPVAAGQNTELKVFPNPNSGTFTMNLLSDNNEEVHVIVTNIIGQKVSEFVTTTNKPVDVKLNSAAGIYLLSATTAHGKYISKVEINPQ